MSLKFLNGNLLHNLYIYLNMCKQMSDVKLLLLKSNSGNNLTVCIQMIGFAFFYLMAYQPL